MKTIDGVRVWGNPLENAVDQAKNCLEGAEYVALMADHHLGYSQPIGGVVAYKDKISPSGVGYDIACGNKAVELDMDFNDDIITSHLDEVLDAIQDQISFGVGRVNKEEVSHILFDDDPAWDIPIAAEIKEMAMEQLGTVGSGNHYVDLFINTQSDRIWIGVHFGSRGLGHKIATHFIKEGGGKNGINAPPVTLDVDSQLGQEYIACMKLAGRYAYAGRDWVVNKVANIMGANQGWTVHNHHNFAWKENHFGEDLWVVRKGATPAYPNQYGFVGASMGEDSVILKGLDTDENKMGLFSTVHGAGRVMSRTQAAGKTRWKKGSKVKVSEGEISEEMMMEWVNGSNVALRGGGTDESPHCYKRLNDVLKAHSESIQVMEILRPIGVVMAGENIQDPYKD